MRLVADLCFAAELVDRKTAKSLIVFQLVDREYILNLLFHRYQSRAPADPAACCFAIRKCRAFQKQPYDCGHPGGRKNPWGCRGTGRHAVVINRYGAARHRAVFKRQADIAAAGARRDELIERIRPVNDEHWRHGELRQPGSPLLPGHPFRRSRAMSGSRVSTTFHSPRPR